MTVHNEIVKASIKNDRCEVTFKERFTEENYSNEVTKKCSQIVHADMKKAFERLKVHLVAICDQKEAAEVLEDFSSYPVENLSNYVVTGYSVGGSDEDQGVTIIGQKLLETGKVLNLIAPFTKYEDLDAYEYANELSGDIHACDCEVLAYMFDGKWGIKQQEFDFEAPEGVDMEDFETAPEFEGLKVTASMNGEDPKEVNLGKLRQLAETA